MLRRLRPNHTKLLRSGRSDRPSRGAPLWAVVGTWMEADIIEATVNHLRGQGVERVLLVDNDSPDDTVSRAIASGAELACRFHSVRYDEHERIRLINETIRDFSERSAHDRIWWLSADADEFVHAPSDETLADFVNGVDERCTVIGARVFDHYPTPGVEYERGTHPLSVQPLCREKRDHRCVSGHHKHPLLRWDRGQPVITVEFGSHQVRSDGTVLYEPRQSVIMHHFPFRNLADSRCRLALLAERGTEAASVKASADNHMRARHASLDAVYRGDYANVIDYRSGQRGLELVDWRELDGVAEHLRVLQVISDRERRGAQTHAVDLSRGLASLDCDVETVALAPGRHGDLLPIEHLGPTPRHPRTLWNLRRRARGFDVVVAHGGSTLLACAVALDRSGVPFVYRQISDPEFWARSFVRRLRVAGYLRRAAHVVALSSNSAEVVIRRYGLERGRLTVIPNAAPGARFRPPDARQRTLARQQWDVGSDEFVALYVGALVPEKGVDLAISAIATRPDVVLLIAGDGPCRRGLERQADTVRPAKARFVGSVDDPQTLYWAADVVVLASRGGDSMPAVLIEAGLCARPAVACAIGAITDIVLDGETGYVVAVDDVPALVAAIGLLADDRMLSQRLGLSAESHCRRKFTIEAVAPHWLSVLAAAARSRSDRVWQ